MRVLHFFKTYRPDTFGGVERVIHAIAESTRVHGVTSAVLSLSRDAARATTIVDGHLAHKARLDLDVASTGLSLEVLGRFRTLAREADVLHYHFPWPMAGRGAFHRQSWQAEPRHLSLRYRAPARPGAGLCAFDARVPGFGGPHRCHLAPTISPRARCSSAIATAPW